MKQVEKILVLGGVGLVLAGTALAQAPPGPIAPVASQRSSSEPPPPPPVKIVPRTNILGAWRLNRDESDDPKARSNQRKSSGSEIKLKSFAAIVVSSFSPVAWPTPT